MKTKLFLTLSLCSCFASAAVTYNFDLARDRGGIVFNASTDDSNLVWNTASPAGTSAMTWNVFNTGTGTLTNATISAINLVNSSGAESTINLSIGQVNTDGYSDQTPKDGIWTSYMTTSATNGSGPTVTLSGFTVGQKVDLVLYTGQARWSGNNTGEFTFGGVTKSYAEALASSTMPLTAGVTFIRFDDLVPNEDGEIIGSFGALASGQEGVATLAGLQFVVVPEPSAALLCGLGLLALLRRHR